MTYKSSLSILAMLFLVSIKISSAQSLIEHLGGHHTSFEFYYGDLELNVIDQAILLRGVSESKMSDGIDAAFGFGYGLQTYHLEFLCSDLTNFRQDKLYYLELRNDINQVILA